jgi:hypothetical protein
MGLVTRPDGGFTVAIGEAAGLLRSQTLLRLYRRSTRDVFQPDALFVVRHAIEKLSRSSRVVLIPRHRAFTSYRAKGLAQIAWGRAEVPRWQALSALDNV